MTPMPATSLHKKSGNIRVLYAVWEIEPFLKIGGLGEVARSLPRALSGMGIDIRLIMPHYRALHIFDQHKKRIANFSVRYGKKMLPITIHKISFLTTNITVYLLGNKQYFDRPEDETFIVFSKAVTDAINQNMFGSWTPEIVHCNDTHTALIPLLLKAYKSKTKSLLTIHCISHQQTFSQTVAKKLHIPDKAFSFMKWEPISRKFNLLAEGIINADSVNTVSPTYLKEIQTEEHGAGLDVIMREHIHKTSAILNGIDYILKNPATNLNLESRYSAKEKDSINDASVVGYVNGKQLNKKLLQARLSLTVDGSTPIIAYIGRFDQRQKGIDLIHRMIVRKSLPPCQFIIMGQGEEMWEERFHLLASFSPDRIAVITVFDDTLASLIYAASDFMLIPSYFEPCCLIQMNAMRYGTLPIARLTGGLNDTILNNKNGYTFTNSSSIELEETIIKAIDTKIQKPHKHFRMVKSAMLRDFSWTKSAKQYIELYRSLAVSEHDKPFEANA